LLISMNASVSALWPVDEPMFAVPTCTVSLGLSLNSRVETLP